MEYINEVWDDNDRKDHLNVRESLANAVQSAVDNEGTMDKFREDESPDRSLIPPLSHQAHRTCSYERSASFLACPSVVLGEIGHFDLIPHLSRPDHISIGSPDNHVRRRVSEYVEGIPWVPGVTGYGLRMRLDGKETNGFIMEDSSGLLYSMTSAGVSFQKGTSTVTNVQMGSIGNNRGAFANCARFWRQFFRDRAEHRRVDHGEHVEQQASTIVGKWDPKGILYETNGVQHRKAFWEIENSFQPQRCRK